jgi:hypothetical protein
VQLPGAPSGMPAFNQNDDAITCGMIAGSNIIAGYDAVHTNLIPSYTPFTNTLGILRWKNCDATIYALQDDLLIRMNGVPYVGVTIPNYLNGLNSYAVSRGRTFTSTSMMSGSTINLSNLMTQINQNRYATIFMNTFTLNAIGVANGVDTITIEEYGGSHAMSVFGYRIIQYFTNGTLTHTRHYLEVSTGFSSPRSLVRINGGFGTVDAIHITHIS